MSDYGDISLPEFPSDVPTAHLSKVSLQGLQNGERQDLLTLFNACHQRGFFLLDMKRSAAGETMLNDVSQLFGTAKSLFDLETSEKLKGGWEPEKACGYKGVGFGKIDRKGTPDRCEFWGISKDSIMDIAQPPPQPDVLVQKRLVLRSLTERAHAACMLILRCLETSMQLPSGALSQLHQLNSPSADSLRLLKMSPQPEGDRRTSLLAHTDFGSVTLLWNVLGGLQIPRSGSDLYAKDGWDFVRPEHGCAVVNMGDSAVALSAGLLRSSLHRVAYAPGLQAVYDRYSIAYFCRPSDDVPMRPMLKGGETVKEKNSETKREITAKEWVASKVESYRKGETQMHTSGGVTAD